MIERSITPRLLALFERYPVLTLTGPRQSGKTTLCRAAFPQLAYVNLENPDQRRFAQEDPRGFLTRYGEGAILDEIQRAPELVSYLQGFVDERRANGLFVLTGSEQFRVSQSISQSLAGRTALLRLLPLSIAELSSVRPELAADVHGLLYTGFYPRIYDQGLDPTQALGDYFETYVERDVRRLGEIRRLESFETFVRLCAGRTGQLLNLSSLGEDAGVSHTTARHWMSVLEASYIVFRLRPYHANVSKRLIKSPKLYFYDVGLAAWLLGIEAARQVASHPLLGSLFENLVVVEALKSRTNRGKRSNLFFYRDRSRTEIDLLYTLADRFLAVEAKAGATVAGSFFRPFARLRELFGDRVAGEILVTGGRESYRRHQVHVTHPSRFAGLLAQLEAEVLAPTAARAGGPGGPGPPRGATGRMG